MLQLITNGRGQQVAQSMEAVGDEYSGQPVSPLSQSLRSSILSLGIHAILEMEEPMTFTQPYAFADAILRRIPVFSCIMVEEDGGVLRWQKTRVNLDDHLIIIDDVDPNWVDVYIYKLSGMPLHLSRPLWEFHVLNHKTSKTGAGATMVMRFHHSLGDGISLMSMLFSVFSRVDNPHLPLTFPISVNSKPKPQPKPCIKHYPTTISDRWSAFTAKFFQMRPFYTLVVGWYILVDVITTFLRLDGWMDDSQLRPTPGASCRDQDQLLSAKLASAKVSFGGHQANKELCRRVGEQISLAEAYEKRFELPQDAVIIKQMKKLRFTALCAINTRSSPGLQNIDDMLKTKSKAAWGNQVYYVPVRIPFSLGKVENPLEFVEKAKHSLDRKKMIPGSIIGRFLRYVAWLKGPQGFSRFVRNAMASSTMRISNMVGPVEKEAIGGNPIKTFSFFVSGGQGTQPLAIYILSYMGTVTMQVKVQNDYVDPKMLSTCLMEAFMEMEASIVHKLAD